MNIEKQSKLTLLQLLEWQQFPYLFLNNIHSVISFFSLNWILHNNQAMVEQSMEDIKSYLDTMYEPKDTEMQVYVNCVCRCVFFVCVR